MGLQRWTHETTHLLKSTDCTAERMSLNGFNHANYKDSINQINAHVKVLLGNWGSEAGMTKEHESHSEWGVGANPGHAGSRVCDTEGKGNPP